jgi:hypothetical protein
MPCHKERLDRVVPNLKFVLRFRGKVILNLIDMTNSETYKYYEPSLAAAVVFAVLYGMTCIATVVQYVYYKSWFWFFAVLASVSE